MAPSTVQPDARPMESSMGDLPIIRDVRSSQGDTVPKSRSSHLRRSTTGIYDLICIGFGPSNLSLAVALHDRFASSSSDHSLRQPSVLFIERHTHFVWHPGMQLAGAKMQISFVKDLATMRDPRSEFTFLNYLKSQGRLEHFTNLGTFLPSRCEYQDYMAWCASAFDRVVEYGSSVVEIKPFRSKDTSHSLMFDVTMEQLGSHIQTRISGRNVVLGIGGVPNIPNNFPQNNRRILHSSEYGSRIAKILPDDRALYNIVVVGGGQSAAEIFVDVQSRYPNCRTRLLVRDTALRPSDDSPFVNEIFNHDRIRPFYSMSSAARAHAVFEDRATNYSVVRLELLEHIYTAQYAQRVKTPIETKWPHRIQFQRAVRSAEPGPSSVKLTVQDLFIEKQNGARPHVEVEDEIMEADVVILATGYRRDAYKSLLHLDQESESLSDAPYVDECYQLHMPGCSETEAGDGGIWMQGCNQSTHGLSDSLLSVLAVRAGELIESILR